MACDYCSTDDDDDRACMCGPEEMCGDCFESRVQPEDVPKILEAMARKPSPTVDLNPTCECGHPLAGHGFGPRCIGNRNLCPCLGFRTPEPKAPERSLYGCCANTQCMCLPAQCHCGEGHEEPSCPQACAEGHTYSGSCLMRADGPEGPKAASCTEACSDGHMYDERCLLEEPEEPPLTPEEEEQAPEDEEACGAWGGCTLPRGHNMGQADIPENHQVPPPQPDRRPPYAVAYSVQGHLFEVALPGDASVKAVDGALVIQHHLGPVLGICQVLPVINGD